MMKIRHTLIALLTAGLFTTPMAMAQGQGQGQAQPMPQQQEAPEVSDAQIEAFVDAYIAVSEVREDYTARLQEAEDQEQAQQLQQEANEAMTSAIEDSGLSVEEYQEVAMAINADADIRDQVTGMLEERGAM